VQLQVAALVDNIALRYPRPRSAGGTKRGRPVRTAPTRAPLNAARTAKFPECETGAMPPFGNLYGMEVFIAESLTANDEIAFNAGSHTEVIKLKFADFERLVKPRVVSFTT